MSAHCLRVLFKMNYKTGFLVIAFLVGCFALPTPEDDMSFFFDETRDTRIVGGTVAPVGSHPHMTALSSGILIRSFICGGSVISQRTVLTAAHCIEAVFSLGSLSSSLRVTVGTNRWNSGGAHYTLARNVTHPHYVASTIKNDIGLLITTSNIVYSQLVQPVPLTFNHVPAGVASRVAGWGRISTNGAISANLLQLDVTTIGDECVRLAQEASVTLNMRAPPVEPHIEVCTYHSPNHGTCRGDSGSALIRRDTNQQFGIVSWGFPCARGAPDMFVRISAFTSFIASNIV